MQARQKLTGRKWRAGTALLLPTLGLSACTTVTVLPELAPGESVTQQLRLPAFYEGDPRHLPQSVVSVANADAPFAYDFQVDTRRNDLPGLLAAFNPLTLVGFPIGQTKVTAVATLTARERGEIVKRYQATAVVSKTRTLFSSDSQTELRTRALAAARDNIETQLQAEARYLRRLESAAAGSTPASVEVPK